MNNLQTLSRDLVEHLALSYEPVGVKLCGHNEPLPGDTPVSGENLKSYCQALALAGKGRTFLLTKEQMGCKLGTTVLGFESDPEAYLDDGVLEKFGVGLFATEEASAATILESVFLDRGKTRAALIAPVGSFSSLPQVVVFTANSEQIMWLLYAANYEKGGRMNLPQSGGALGGCADITALPLREGLVNVTFLGLGCRLKSALDPAELMMGVPGAALEGIHRNVLAMVKPIAMLRSAHRAAAGRRGATG
jgi:uncharacterized protein (DUF169 family)